MNSTTPSDRQMTLPQDIVCATISSHFYENARIRITEFLRDSSQRMVTYGYSSSGARAHILYRSENGKLFVLFEIPTMATGCITSGRTCCIVSSKAMKTKSRASEEEVFIPPPMMIGRAHSCACNHTRISAGKLCT